MKSILILLLAVLSFSVLGLWFIRDTTILDLENSRFLQFVDVLLQSLLSASVLGIVLELALWKLGSDVISARLKAIGESLEQSVSLSINKLSTRIPALTATSDHNLNGLSKDDAVDVVKRVMSHHCSDLEVVSATTRIVKSIVEMDDKSIVSNLRNVINVFEENGVLRTCNSVSYNTATLPEQFTFGIFSDSGSHERYVRQNGEIDGFWIAKKAFSADGAYKGNMVFISELCLISDDGRKFDIDMNASKGSGSCIYSTDEFPKIERGRILYKINAFVSRSNPLIQISTPFVTNHMTVRLKCDVVGLKQILHRASVPFNGTVTVPEQEQNSVEVLIEDVVFPGHGVTFSLRFD